MAFNPVYIGSFFILVAAVLLLLSSISAPVIHTLSFLDIQNGKQKSTYGAFGYCTNVVGSDSCSSAALGYDIVKISGKAAQHSYTSDSLEGLTSVLVLHPAGCALSFLAFFLSMCTNRFGLILSSFLTTLAFLASLVVMVIDFALFAIVRNEINSTSSKNVSASFGVAIWFTLGATLALMFAGLMLGWGCCAGRRSDAGSGQVGMSDKEAAMGLQGNKGLGGWRWWKSSKYRY
ncbi:hypothetical protein IAT38_004958 [Cryptococcus sp. DSM 104549]